MRLLALSVTFLMLLPCFAGSVLAQVGAGVLAQVYVGRIPCELGVVVTLEADPLQAAQFIMKVDKQTYLLTPVETSTGVIRLEDKKAGAVWLQLANKSMLMNQKLGRRIADECMNPMQISVAQALKANPAPSLLDAPNTPVAQPSTAGQVLPVSEVARAPLAGVPH